MKKIEGTAARQRNRWRISINVEMIFFFSQTFGRRMIITDFRTIALGRTEQNIVLSKKLGIKLLGLLFNDKKKFFYFG